MRAALVRRHDRADPTAEDGGPIRCRRNAAEPWREWPWTARSSGRSALSGAALARAWRQTRQLWRRPPAARRAATDEAARAGGLRAGGVVRDDRQGSGTTCCRLRRWTRMRGRPGRLAPRIFRVPSRGGSSACLVASRSGPPGHLGTTARPKSGWVASPVQQPTSAAAVSTPRCWCRPAKLRQIKHLQHNVVEHIIGAQAPLPGARGEPDAGAAVKSARRARCAT